jgi:hypothetical protein
MEEYKIIKQLEYLVAFQNECLSKGDFEGFDKAENGIKKLEKLLVDSNKKARDLEDIELKNVLESIGTVSSY